MASILTGSLYSPARGGHAPGDVRDAFFAAVEAYDAWEISEPEPTVELRGQRVPISQMCGLLWNCTEPEPTVELRGQRVPISQMCGLLWNCTDTMPNLLCGHFRDCDEPVPGSYAVAARLLRSRIRHASTAELLLSGGK
jgi:hypothetical protein